jgi:hypothetical protein
MPSTVARVESFMLVEVVLVWYWGDMSAYREGMREDVVELKGVGRGGGRYLSFSAYTPQF